MGRDNITIFAHSCEKMGIRPEDTLSPAMFDGNQRKEIVNSLLRFAIYGCKAGLKVLTAFRSERMQTCSGICMV